MSSFIVKNLNGVDCSFNDETLTRYLNVAADELYKRESKTARVDLDIPRVDLNIPMVVENIFLGLKRYSTLSEGEFLGHVEEVLVGYGIKHPTYLRLAAQLCIEDLHKKTPVKFTHSVELLRRHVCPLGKSMKRLSDTYYEFVMKNADAINAAIVPRNDYKYTYFGFKTMQRQSYLWTLDGKTVETPQYALMRVACGIFAPKNNLEMALAIYRLLSEHYFSPATPQWFNAGSPNQSLASCFLLSIHDDSIEGIYNTLAKCATIIKYSGGVGLDITNIRASGSIIRGTNGISNGIIPMIRVFNESARYVDQGGGKRKGAIAVYLQPWHPNTMEFIRLRSPGGSDLQRARDTFLGMWIPDLFMRRVEADEKWTFICPSKCPALAGLSGSAFDAMYEKCEAEGLGTRTIRARDLFSEIVRIQGSDSMPYMLFKDACIRACNQSHSGIVRSSNLCTEIVQICAPDEIAVCNLSSVSLKKFVLDGAFDFKMLHHVAQNVVELIDTMIDVTSYSLPETENSNLKHRPMGIGVQGLNDAYRLLGIDFDSREARILNVQIFETIMHAAYTKSCSLARRHGPYKSYPGSNVARGILHPDLCLARGDYTVEYTSQLVLPASEAARGIAPLWDWKELRADIKEHGIRNSLLIAPMPTATTSQILGNTEAMEIPISNIFSRRVLSGEYIVVSEYLINDLMKLGLWTEEMRLKIIAANGSVQGIDELPLSIKRTYRTAFEYEQRTIVEMAADRMPFIDQNQSLNIHMINPSCKDIINLHFYAWKRGMKSSMYYLRRNASADAIKFTVDRKYLTGTDDIKESKKIDISKELVTRLPLSRDSEMSEYCFIREDGSKSCCSS